MNMYLYQSSDDKFQKNVKMIDRWDKPVTIHKWFFYQLDCYEMESGKIHPINLMNVEGVYRECYEYIKHFQNTLPDDIPFKQWTLKQILKRDIPTIVGVTSNVYQEVIKTLKVLDKILQKSYLFHDTNIGVCASW